jgi:hypothetical protein
VALTDPIDSRSAAEVFGAAATGPARRPIEPGPQPVNQIAATLTEQLARIDSPSHGEAGPDERRRAARRRLVRLVRRAVRRLLARELPAAVARLLEEVRRV